MPGVPCALTLFGATMNDLRERILRVIRQPHLAVLATVTEDGKPWARYVMPCASDDLSLRFASYTDARKVQQITHNPEVHLTCGVLNPLAARMYLQIQGRARFTTDREERHAFWSDLLCEIFSGPDDPRFGVVIVAPYRVELHTVGCPEPEIWERAVS